MRWTMGSRLVRTFGRLGRRGLVGLGSVGVRVFRSGVFGRDLPLALTGSSTGRLIHKVSAVFFHAL